MINLEKIQNQLDLARKFVPSERMMTIKQIKAQIEHVEMFLSHMDWDNAVNEYLIYMFEYCTKVNKTGQDTIHLELSFDKQGMVNSASVSRCHAQYDQERAYDAQLVIFADTVAKYVYGFSVTDNLFFKKRDELLEEIGFNAESQKMVMVIPTKIIEWTR